jgi:anti-sigma regulatory factor (Ser/Thr protein kinase)
MIAGQQATEADVTSATYPGTPDSVPAARRLVRGLVVNSPRAYDLELITTELVTNAIRHTPSGQPGGTFTITIRYQPGLARLEITDLGASPWCPAQPNGGVMAEQGRGMEIVRALADEVGNDVTVGQDQVSWAVLTW